MAAHRSQRPCRNADIVLQTGFQSSQALRTAIAEEIPYIIAECPAYRHLDGIGNDSHINWGYGGLMGGAWHPEPEKKQLWTPELKPTRTGDKTLIICQKSNDHSLRGHNHDEWIEKKLLEYPEATVRPHPIMWAVELPDIDWSEWDRVITYSSTAGAEALIEGCQSDPEHWGSPAYKVTDRKAWIRALSYQNFTKEMMASSFVGKHIMSGFEEARERAEQGLQETPRDKRDMKGWCYSPKIEERINASSITE